MQVQVRTVLAPCGCPRVAIPSGDHRQYLLVHRSRSASSDVHERQRSRDDADAAGKVISKRDLRQPGAADRVVKMEALTKGDVCKGKNTGSSTVLCV